MHDPSDHPTLRALWLRSLVSLGPFGSVYPRLPHPHPSPPASGDDLRKHCSLEGTPSTSRPAPAPGLSSSPPILPASALSPLVADVLGEQPVHLGSEPITHSTPAPISLCHLFSSCPTFSISLPHPLLALSPHSTDTIGSSCSFRNKKITNNHLPPDWFTAPVSAMLALSLSSLSILALVLGPHISLALESSH